MDVLQGKECGQKDTEVIWLAKKWLDRYFLGEKPAIGELSIQFIGSDFRVAVWQMLTEIPYGAVITYGELAKRIARKRGLKAMSAQSVGGAVGHNPISILVPCHRVVGANGNFIGYSSGVGTKMKLLELEGVDVNNYYLPVKGTVLKICEKELLC